MKISSQCKCLDGFKEQDPPVNDCMILPCEEPCKACVEGSNILCQSCIDSFMTIINKQCDCPLRYYFS